MTLHITFSYYYTSHRLLTGILPTPFGKLWTRGMLGASSNSVLLLNGHWPNIYEYAELVFKLQQINIVTGKPCIAALFLLEKRENKICLYREELCVYKELLSTIKGKCQCSSATTVLHSSKSNKDNRNSQIGLKRAYLPNQY